MYVENNSFCFEYEISRSVGRRKKEEGRRKKEEGRRRRRRRRRRRTTATTTTTKCDLYSRKWRGFVNWKVVPGVVTKLTLI